MILLGNTVGINQTCHIGRGPNDKALTLAVSDWLMQKQVHKNAINTVFYVCFVL